MIKVGLAFKTMDEDWDMVARMVKATTNLRYAVKVGDTRGYMEARIYSNKIITKDQAQELYDRACEALCEEGIVKAKDYKTLLVKLAAMEAARRHSEK